MKSRTMLMHLLRTWQSWVITVTVLIHTLGYVQDRYAHNHYVQNYCIQDNRKRYLLFSPLLYVFLLCLFFSARLVQHPNNACAHPFLLAFSPQKQSVVFKTAQVFLGAYLSAVLVVGAVLAL
ncbi:hypothetical protein CBF23_012855 [Marinomonas agarivorans]|nr:hypothetical protein CBF23_012855 [Marinomonas agarivorans]